MKTVIKDGQTLKVAESADEALRMFKKQLKARKEVIINDDPERFNGWDDEDTGFSSYRNNRNYYDYGD